MSKAVAVETSLKFAEIMQKIQEVVAWQKVKPDSGVSGGTEDERLDYWGNYIEIYDSVLDLKERNPSLPPVPQCVLTAKQALEIRVSLFLRKLTQCETFDAFLDFCKGRNFRFDRDGNYCPAQDAPA